VHSATVGDGVDARAVRDGYAELLARVPWSYFVTLTYDPKRHPRSGEESWRKSWEWFLWAWLRSSAIAAGQAWEDDRGNLRGPWVNAWRKGSGRPVWVLALEPHRDDRLHAHVLLRMTRNLPWLDWKVGQVLWRSNRGGCWFEAPRDHEHVTRYVAKYILKSGSEGLFLSPNFDAPRMGCLTPDA